MKLFVLSLTLLLAASTQAQEKKVAPTSNQLYNTIRTQDSLFFAAFNAQHLALMKTFFSPSLEWFQDNGGLINYDTVFINFAQMYTRPYKLTRTLIEGSLEVHPIKDYGAIEIGTHQFEHIENGKLEIGTFKFLMIWKETNGNGRLPKW
ncbi:nuclear transport factor 2 family protein [Parasediminibacterium paludis]|uniref:Nuclear transport factor 2 family protein n=1 Tax=Parasediminibacterium paludis TaxID=908966 RepID=A0ABV8PYI4_9BACT